MMDMCSNFASNAWFAQKLAFLVKMVLEMALCLCFVRLVCSRVGFFWYVRIPYGLAASDQIMPYISIAFKSPNFLLGSMG